MAQPPHRPRATRRRIVLLPIAVAVITALVLAPRAFRARDVHVPPFDRQSHLALVASRRSAAAVNDLPAVARINGQLAAESLRRARAVHDAWMARRHRRTGLFPQSMEFRQWNYQNVASDFFCFQIAVAVRTGAPSVPLLMESLASERALSPKGGLCVPLSYRTGRQLDATPFERLFATSEYLKDGLVGLYERTGEPLVLERIRELADAVIAQSNTQSRFGPIPSTNSELNGNVLQAFSRLAFITGDAHYADMVGTLADAVVQQMLAKTGGLPVMEFDYAHDTFSAEFSQLRDHGNETAVGLSEAFALAVARSADPGWSARAARWAAPLAEMYELILNHGANAEGLLASRMTLNPPAPTDDPACDNWGYLLSGAMLFADAASRAGLVPAERLDKMLARVDAIAIAVTKTDGYPWEGTHHDGYADSIESAIYVASRRPAIRRELLDWATGQVGRMYAGQREDGFVSGDYLDGNFIRTAMLLADALSAGLRLDPWSPEASVGVAGAGAEAIVTITAGPKGYQGMLVSDEPRHRTRLHLPWDWARINSWPEWCGAEPAKQKTIDLSPGQVSSFPIRELGVEPWRVP